MVREAAAWGTEMRNSDTENLNSLDEGLRVRHIANFPLVTCGPGDDGEELFAHAEYKEFDQIPIKDGARITSIWERSNPSQLRALDDSVLVAADSPLSHFIHTVHEQPYRLVVDGTAITSIVTWSDLLKLPVTVLAFSLVAQLELAMNARIKEKYGDENGWLELLATKDKKKIVGRLQKLQLENLALSVLELADFSDKARVLHERLAATDFENDLEHLKSLRNEIAHVKDIVRSDADLKTFVRRVEIAERWMGTLAGEKASSAAAP